MSNQNKKGLSPLKAGVIGVFSIIAFFTGLLLLFSFLMPETKESTYPSVSDHGKYIAQQQQEKKRKEAQELYLSRQAYLFAQDLIIEYLKSPSSAEFPGSSQIKLVPLGNDRYYIDGYLDSQNGFGAQVRTKYQCWVLYKQNERISIENIQFK